MTEGFATKEFIEFSLSSDNVVYSGVFKSRYTACFPYHIVRRKNGLYPEGGHFFITPICLSGPSYIDLMDCINEIQIQLARFNIVGGFIQSRDKCKPVKTVISGEHWNSFVDYRTNYQIPLGLSDDEYLSRMKRDSKSRVRIIKKLEVDYQIVKLDNSNQNLLQEFSTLYTETAINKSFTKSYQFKVKDWKKLFCSDQWGLYVLLINASLAAGAVVSRTSDGVDYTFMGYNPAFADVSRANIFFLYKYLSRITKGYMHLGGGIVEGDALAKFKQSMGGEPVYFKRIRFSLKKDLDNDLIFNQLQKRWP